MSTHDLKDAFIAEMRDMPGAEKQINKALKTRRTFVMAHEQYKSCIVCDSIGNRE